MLLREVVVRAPGDRSRRRWRFSREHDGARALAGGQTLVNVMKQRAASPDVLVDLRGSRRAPHDRGSGDDALELGAMVTLSRSSGRPRSRSSAPDPRRGRRDGRRRPGAEPGTVGGNICVNDPTNHFPPLLVALGATMTIRSATGERTVPADEFFVGVFETAVGEGDLLTRIAVPARPAATGCRA